MGSLPFYQVGEVQAQGGETLLESIPCSTWPASSSNTQVGQRYDHEGEARYEDFPELSTTNASLVVEGTTYKIVQVVAHPFLPHVALLLRRIVPGGGG